MTANELRARCVTGTKTDAGLVIVLTEHEASELATKVEVIDSLRIHLMNMRHTIDEFLEVTTR